jgi:hypothetical protein
MLPCARSLTTPRTRNPIHGPQPGALPSTVLSVHPTPASFYAPAPATGERLEFRGESPILDVAFHASGSRKPARAEAQRDGERHPVNTGAAH